MKVLGLSGGKDSMACLFLLRDELDAAIYVDTGYAYPETQQMIALAETMVPVHRIRVDRDTNHRKEGIPADVVPVEWTVAGQWMTSPKPYRIQPSFQCCLDNLAKPLFATAKQLGATHVIFGQRRDEPHRSTARDGDTVDGMIRMHPIEQWTRDDVLQYLSTKMDVPPHFHFAQSSLDCYDCTAFHAHSLDRLAWTKEHYPTYYAAYAQKYNAVLAAVESAL